MLKSESLMAIAICKRKKVQLHQKCAPISKFKKTKRVSIANNFRHRQKKERIKSNKQTKLERCNVFEIKICR